MTMRRSKSQRIAGEATAFEAARMRAASAEVSPLQPAGDNSSADDNVHSRGFRPRDDVDPELEVIYSGESDDHSDSKTNLSMTGSPEAKLPSKSGGSYLTPAEHYDIFGPSDASDESPLHQERSPVRSGDRDVEPSVDITQDERDRNVMRVSPEQKPWWLPQNLITQWFGMTSDSFRIKLFDSSRLHGLDPSAVNYRTESEFYIDVFLKHRWYSKNHNRDSLSLLQAWNAFISNVSNIGKDAWLDKLDASQRRFEKRTPKGARYKLHRLSREAGLLCLSWGDPCPGCIGTSSKAPKEAYLLDNPYWRARISSEMREGIANLQSLYERTGRSFSDGPPGSSDVPRHTARRGRENQPAVGHEVPSYPPKADSHATGRGNSSVDPSRRGGSVSVPRGNASHHESPPADAVVEEKPGLTVQLNLDVEFDRIAQTTRRLERDVDHERGRRRALGESVHDLAHDLTAVRACRAESQLENEKSFRLLREELAAVRKENEQQLRSLHDELVTARQEIASLNDQVAHLGREQKSQVETLERGGYLRRSKKSRT